MPDNIEIIGRSVVQHGASNDRVYLMKLHPNDAPHLPDRLEEMAITGGYSKVFAKVPSWATGRFIGAGYEMEAEIPCFYAEGAAACFLGKFFAPQRQQERNAQLVREVLSAADAQKAALQPSRQSVTALLISP